MTDDKANDIELNYDKIVDASGEIQPFKEYLDRCRNSYKNHIGKGILAEEWKTPMSLQFELTHKCNQRCLHCYNQSGMESNLKSDCLLKNGKN